MTDSVTAVTLEGREYTDVDGYSFIFVADGIAFGETLTVQDGYYVSIPPTRVTDLSGGELRERTLYRAAGRMYISEVPDESTRCSGTPDYSIDGTLWVHEGTVTLSEAPDGAEDIVGAEYVRLTAPNSHTDEKVIPVQSLLDRVRSGKIKQLWPVWKSGHR